MNSTPRRSVLTAFAQAAPCLLLFWLIATPRLVSADWPPDGLALSTAPGLQGGVKLAPDGEGGVFAVWAGSGSGGSGIYAQRIGPDGSFVPGWPLAGLPVCTAAGTQESPQSAPDGLGGVVVAWNDTRDGVYYSIYAQRIRPDGTIHPGWPADGMPVVVGRVWPDGDLSQATLMGVAADDAGGAFVGYQSFSQGCEPDYGCHGFYPPPIVRHLTASGALGGGTQVGDYDWGVLHIVPDGAGGVICAEFQLTGAIRPLWVSRITSSGTEMWSRELLLGPGNLRSVALAPDGFGGVFIACGKNSRTASGEDVWAQRLTSSGTEASGWPVGGLPVSTASGIQEDPVVALGEPGNLIVCWVDSRYLGSSDPFQNADVFAQMLGPDGVPLPGWPVNGAPVCSAPRAQRRPQLAYDALGGAWVTWFDQRDSLASTVSRFATRLTPTGGPAPGWPADGKRITATASIQDDYTRNALVPSGPNAVIVAWQDARGGGVAQDDVYAQRVFQDAPVAILVDLISAVGSPGRVDLTGFVAGQVSARVVIYRRTENGEAAPLATVGPDGEGHITFGDLDVVAGTRYWYRLGIQGDGGEVFSREVSVLVPSKFQLSLTTPYPSAGNDDLTSSLNLTGSGPATLELIDLSGRRLAEVSIEHLGAGPHTVSFPQSRGLPAGVYLVRLSEGERSIVRRTCLIR